MTRDTMLEKYLIYNNIRIIFDLKKNSLYNFSFYIDI